MVRREFVVLIASVLAPFSSTAYSFQRTDEVTLRVDGMT